MELRIPHNYFSAWMLTPSISLADSRLVDMLNGGTRPLIRALEEFGPD
jgi:hypothetical protein